MVAFLFAVICVGALLYLVNKHLEMAPPFKAALNIIACLGLIYYALRLFGLIGGANAPGL